MEFSGNIVVVQPFVTVTIAIIVLFVGRTLTNKFKLLRDINIPQSVSGGLAISLIVTLIYFVSAREIQFDLSARIYFIVYFFTAIGLNTKLRDLVVVRRPLITFIVVTVVYMAFQDIVAVSIARVFGYSGPQALLAGSVALAGGYETVKVWETVLVSEFGIKNAGELGIASATFGLVLGSLIGGPIAGYLISKHRLQTDATKEQYARTSERRTHDEIDHFDFLQSILVIHVCAIFGVGLNQILSEAGVVLPVPVSCFLVAIFLTNVVPTVFPSVAWPSRTLSLSLIAELSLGIFFGMSLISAPLWVIVNLPPQLLAILVVQVFVLVPITIYLILRVMGRDYDAAVICSGFSGLALGSTSTAMANMKAVAKNAGILHAAFIIVPLTAVLCTEVVNGLLIQLFLARF